MEDLKSEVCIEGLGFSTDKALAPVPISKSSAVFWTGASGFLGAFILEQLLTQTRAKIYCLMRAESVQEGEAKILKQLIFAGLWDPSFEGRIKIVTVNADCGKSAALFSNKLSECS